MRQRFNLCEEQRVGKDRPAMNDQGQGLACAHSSSAERAASRSTSMPPTSDRICHSVQAMPAEAGTRVDIHDVAEETELVNDGMAAHDEVDTLDGLRAAAADA